MKRLKNLSEIIWHFIENNMIINTLGTGGAFDTREGCSSFIVEYGNNYLVDCGYDVFPKLLSLGVEDKIDYIVVTHCHDDHIGSLSAYLYYLFYVLKKSVPILTTFEVAKDLNQILRRMGMTYGKEYSFFYGLDEVSVIATDNLHCEGMPSCAVRFGDDLFISGDVGCSLMDIAKAKIVYHDASAFENPVHCHYKKLMPADNLYLYHHSGEQRKEMIAAGFKFLEPNKEIVVKYGTI